MKRYVRVIAAVAAGLLAVAAVPIGLLGSAFIGNLAVPDRDERDGVTLVKDGFVTAYVVDAGAGQIASTGDRGVRAGANVVDAVAAHAACLGE